MDAKTTVAAAFAALGVGVGAWGLLGSGRAVEAAPARSARAGPVEPVDAEGRPATAAYERLGRDPGVIVARLAAGAAEAARAVKGFGSQGAGSAGSFGGAVESVLLPLASGDHDAFLAAVRALGAVIGEIEGEHPLFQAISAKLKGAEVDLSRLDVRPYERSGPGGPGGAGPNPVVAGGASRGEGETRVVRERVNEMRAGRMFPGAMEGLNERAVEVRFPFRPKGEDEQWLGVVFVWSAKARAWQPAAYRVMVRGVAG